MNFSSAWQSWKRRLFPPEPARQQELFVYGLCYRFPDVAAPAIESILAAAPGRLKLCVVENAYQGGHPTKDLCLGYLSEKKIHAYVAMGSNAFGTAFASLYRLFPPPADQPIVVFSDLDLVIPEHSRDWANQMLGKFERFPELGAISLDFDLGNWNRKLAPGHKPASRSTWSRRYGLHLFRSGIWCLGLRRDLLDDYLRGGGVFGDSEIFKYLQGRHAVFGRLPIYCRHLSWDKISDESYLLDKKTNYTQNWYSRHDDSGCEVFQNAEEPRVTP